MMRVPNHLQQAVIDEFERDILLQAPAGTGKTFTVAKKIAAAVLRGLPSENILCLTFTKKAAKEIADDVRRETDGAEITVSTIHGFCYGIVNRASKRLSRSAHSVICDEEDSKRILHDTVLAEMNELYARSVRERLCADGGIVTLAKSDERYLYCLERDGAVLYFNAKGELLDQERLMMQSTVTCPKCGHENENGIKCAQCGNLIGEYLIPVVTSSCDLFRLVSLVRHEREYYGIHSGDDRRDYRETYTRLTEEKNELLSKIFETRAGTDNFAAFAPKWIAPLITRYLEELRALGLADFDDLVFDALSILSDEETARSYREQYKLLIVDEVQDTSLLEYRIISRLFSGQVVFCGDYHQSIYGWRGAVPDEIIRQFRQERNVLEMTLEDNLRSNPNLVAAANAFLTGEDCKGLVLSGDAPIELHESYDGGAMTKFIFDRLKDMTEESRAKSCVMARTNASLNSFEASMSELNANNEICFIRAEEERDFFKKPTVKDLLNILRVILNPMDEDAYVMLCRNRFGIPSQTLRGVRSMGRLGVGLSDYAQSFDVDYYEDLNQAYDTNSCIIFDLETTGLDLTTDETIQLAAIKFGIGGVKQSFCTYIKTDQKISPQAFAAHGISEEVLHHEGVDRKSALKKFAEFAHSCVLAGFNSAAFDLGLLTRECRQLEIPINIRKHYDIMTIAKRLYPNEQNYKLETLCKKFGIVNRQAHDALSDVEASMELLKIELETLLSEGLKRKKYYTNRNRESLLPMRDFGRWLTAWRHDLTDGRTLNEMFKEAWELIIDPKLQETEQLNILCRLTDAQEPIESVIRGLLSQSLDGNIMWAEIMRKNGAVPLLTVHQSKGCEFDTVFLIDADANKFPNFLAVKENAEKGLAEERRVFYVALTRAKKNVVAVFSSTKVNAVSGKRWKQLPSPFFDQIPAIFIKKT